MITVKTPGIRTGALVPGADAYSVLFVDALGKLATDSNFNFDAVAGRRLYLKTDNVNQSAAIYDSIASQAVDLVQFNINGTTQSRINSDGQYQGNRVAITYIREPNDALNCIQFVAGSRRVIFIGGLYPGSLTDAAAPNSTLYDSSTSGKLTWKDAGGVANPLY